MNTIKEKINRLWIDYMFNANIYGYIHALLKEFPFYRFLNKIYWFFCHRTINVYHKITIGKPGYYETDVRILYACFIILKEYIDGYVDFEDNRLKGTKAIEKKIERLYDSWEEDRKTGWSKRKKTNRYDYQETIEQLNEAIRLYDWWVNIFPTYDDNNPYYLHFNEMYPDEYPNMSRKILTENNSNAPYIGSFLDDSDVPKKIKTLRKKYLKESMEYEIKIMKDTTDNLIALMKIRHSLWD